MILKMKTEKETFIPISKPSITELEIEYVTDAIKSGWVSSNGRYINIFEKKFAEYCGTNYALTTSTGTSALHLALVSYGIKEGDEVIVPDFTFVSTANAVTYIGATVILIDIEEDTLCIDPVKVEQAITDKTKAIIPVHIYGHPANMREINQIAQKYNLIVLEDAAEAHGSEVKSQKTGSLGHCAIFSFYGNKIITCGQGGMITTNDYELYQKARYLREYAQNKERRYWHEEIGYNYRMTNLQAALGLAQLERINDIIERKREIFSLYHQNMEGCDGVKLNFTADWALNNYWLICLQVENFTETERNIFMKYLSSRGIESRPFFYPLSNMPMYIDSGQRTHVSHAISPTGVNLPSYEEIKTEDINYICNCIKTYLSDVDLTVCSGDHGVTS